MAPAGRCAFAGPSGGYLIAFPFAAALTGWLAARGWDRQPFTMFAAMLLGSAVIFALGLAQLSRFVPAGAAARGRAAAVRRRATSSSAALAAGLSPAAWKLAGGPEAK